MKRELIVRRLIIPLVVAFILMAPLLGAAVIGEHRYELHHPAYAGHMVAKLLGEEMPDHWDEPAFPVSAQSDVKNILVLGRDAQAGLTDVMILVSMDAEKNSMQLIQLPRDTYANYTSKNYKKINGAYRTLGGTGVTEFFKHHLGVPVDRYVCVDLAVFSELVDALGGVPIHIPADMDYDDPAQSLHIHLNAGDQVLNGQQAQMFVRFRSGYASADLGRMDAQKLFLAALAKQVKATLTLPKAVELASGCFGKLKTNLSLRECIGCVRTMMNLELDAVQMSTLAGQSATPKAGGAWYYIVNRESAQKQLSEAFGKEITFDPERVFTNASCDSYQNIYNAPADRFKTNRQSAQDMLGGALTPTRIS